MQRKNPRRFQAVLAWSLIVVLFGIGADKGKKVPNLKEETLPKSDETVGDIAFARANANTVVEGVGLVIGLNNTGSNPSPSLHRTKLLTIMRKATVPNAERWLESPTTSLVLVQGTIPQGITTRDEFDIDVVLPPGSTTTSLEGGHLLVTELRVKQFIDGQYLEGQPMGEAGGPIMVGDAQFPDEPRVGRVLGGAHTFKDNFYALVLKEDRKGFRTSKLLEDVINMRFFERKGIEQVGMAIAKTDELLVLNVPRVYHHNQWRYFQVIERLPMVDSPALRASHLDAWTKELLDAKTSGQAALKLEGIGRNAADALKGGLESPNEQVRFFAAEALAYLNDAAGADILATTAAEHLEFRANALAALAAMDQPASVLRLRSLMDQADPNLRYGAFNALRTLDEHDPFLGRVRLLRDARPETTDDAELAMRLYSAPSRQSARLEDPFELYVVECDGPAMIHISRSRRREIVLFGRGQNLLTPVAVGGAGSILLNAALNDDRVEISRFDLSQPGVEPPKVMAPLALSEVIREIANLGATYPDLVGILQVASHQKNLPGPLVIDAVPEAMPDYDAAQLAGVDATADPSVRQAGYDEKPEGEATPGRERTSILQRLRRRFDR